MLIFGWGRSIFIFVASQQEFGFRLVGSISPIKIFNQRVCIVLDDCYFLNRS